MHKINQTGSIYLLLVFNIAPRAAWSFSISVDDDDLKLGFWSSVGG